MCGDVNVRSCNAIEIETKRTWWSDRLSMNQQHVHTFACIVFKMVSQLMSSFELFKLGGHLDEKWWLGWGSSQQVPRKQKRPLITECIDAQKKIMINVGGMGAWSVTTKRHSPTGQRIFRVVTRQFYNYNLGEDPHAEHKINALNFKKKMRW